MNRDYRREIEGFLEIQGEIEILRKYGLDYTANRGKVSQIIDRLHPKKIRLRVSEIRQETKTTGVFRLVSADTYLPPFQAGQYINLFVDLKGIRTSRPYSIASPPNQMGYYEIAVRRVDGGFVSNYLLDEVKVGDAFESSGPAGNFFHNPLFHGNDLVFLVGGSGITPFMSMIREVTDRGLGRRIHLIYGSQKPDDVIYRKELEERAGRHDNLKVTTVISDPPEGYAGLKGLITAEFMMEVLGDLASRTFYLCGPEEMYLFCLGEMQKLGVPSRKIRMEVFGPPRDITAQPGWPQEVQKDQRYKVEVKGNRVIEARAGEPLIIALEKAGIAAPASCRSGECSLCRTRLISGRVFQAPQVKLRKSDRAFGFIHSCLAYPLGDLEIMI